MLTDIKYFIKKFDFLKVYNSPFKPLKLKFYIGEIAIGTPYFFPRRWVKLTKKEAIQKALEKKISDSITDKEMRDKVFKASVESYSRWTKPVPKIIGFDFVGMGWKTKWDNYRFEWSPVWSFVFFKWQIAITFVAPELDHYWECWLYYDKETDKTKTPKERIEEARNRYPCNWERSYNGVKEKICYWDLILKNKYL